MADPEQLERLKRSVGEWNAWRQGHPKIRPDLSYASLYGADLSYASLYGADLGYADLNRANLNRAFLLCANLNGANLSGANLIHTDLRSASLHSADLSSANLSSADLSGADLSAADLSSADFNQTIFSYTVFAWTDLLTVKGLDTAIHLSPSSVDVKSVELPQGDVLKSFLRGTGFSDTFIEYLPSLLNTSPIQFQSCFISYSSKDDPFAKKLHADLQECGVRCWFAPHDLRPGNYYRQGIDRAIHTQDKVLLLLSEHSVISGWVRYEVELTLSRENRQRREILCPLRLDDAIFHCTEDWAISLRETRHIGDFTGWQDETACQQAFDTLLRHLKVTKL